MNKLYILLSFSLIIAGYNVGDMINETDLNTLFPTCYSSEGIENIQFGNYKYSSVIWIDISASW